MKSFEYWMATGPLAGEFLTEVERTRLKLAYLGGALEANAEHGAALERLSAGVGAHTA